MAHHLLDRTLAQVAPSMPEVQGEAQVLGKVDMAAMATMVDFAASTSWPQLVLLAEEGVALVAEEAIWPETEAVMAALP